MRKRSLLIFGHYGVPNWGDEAILHGLLSHIDLTKWEVTIVSPFPTFITDHYQHSSVFPPPAGIRSAVRSIVSGNIFSTLRAIPRSDFVLFGGGGLFQSHPPRALTIWNWYLRLCQWHHKRLIIVGNSIGPFASRKKQKKTSRLFAHVSFFSVRDQKSAQTLQDMNVSPERISTATDLAFCLPQKRTKKLNKKSLLLCLRSEDISTREEKHLQSFVKASAKKKWNPQFLPMQVPQSHDERIGERLNLPTLFPDTLSEVRDAIGMSEIVIANRLHACILAMLSATPFIAFGSRPKIKDFLNNAQLSELFISGKITNKKIEQKMKYILAHKKTIQTKIRAAVRREKLKTQLLFPDFF